jgi:pimeloyl-ACP methyl ester carboxylesterase
LHNARAVPARAPVLVPLIASLSSVLACSEASSPADHPDAQTASIDAPPPPLADAPQTEQYLCRQAPPAGAPSPEPPPLPAAGCPTLAPGINTITSSGEQRQFILVVPESPLPGKQPVLFMWHWIGGSANSFLTKGEVQAAADQQSFIAVIPVAKGATVIGTSFNTRWPFDISQTPGRMAQEFKFFDDMLACVQQQLAVNEHCVSSVGVSAGALFNAQLAQARSNRLASFVSLSGGVGATIIKPWQGAARKLPGVVLWGGDGPPAMDGSKDLLGCAGVGMDFSVASKTLETALDAGGHFFLECKHNCGHVEPPLEPPPGESKYAGMWQFALDHPYWLPAGTSPYQTQGLPPAMPAWCGVGAGGATPRTGGGCPAAENPCES